MQQDESNPIDNWISGKEEPVRGYLVALRNRILARDKDVVPAWRYSMPFFCYKEKRFCYIWIDKKTNQPYLGIVAGKQIHHPLLIQQKRTRMKILPLDANKDMPVKVVDTILKEALKLVKTKVKSL